MQSMTMANFVEHGEFKRIDIILDQYEERTNVLKQRVHKVTFLQLARGGADPSGLDRDAHAC
jgi:hypothetical protein